MRVYVIIMKCSKYMYVYHKSAGRISSGSRRFEGGVLI